MKRPPRNLRILALAAALLAANGCKVEDVATPFSSRACAAGSALIQVGEGFLNLECGCAEGAGVIVAQGTSATCTVNVGTQLVFNFLGIKTRHQIVGEGSPDLGASSVVTPANAGTRPFVAGLPAVGTYGFRDAFNTSIFGQIVVQ